MTLNLSSIIKIITIWTFVIVHISSKDVDLDDDVYEKVQYTESDEERFVHLYGDEEATSGIWPQVRAIASDEQKLRNVTFQAHTEAGMKDTDVIDAVSFGTKTLTFDAFRFRPIELDVITYNLTRLPDHYLHICKGLGPDCAFYLIDGEKNDYYLGMHVWNITFV